MLSWQRGDSQRKGTLMDEEKTFLSLTLDSRYTQITVNTPLQLQFSVDASRVSDWTDRLYKGLVASICCCRLRKKKKNLCLLFAAFTQDLDQLFNERYALQQHISVSRDLKRHRCTSGCDILAPISSPKEGQVRCCLRPSAGVRQAPLQRPS